MIYQLIDYMVFPIIQAIWISVIIMRKTTFNIGIATSIMSGESSMILLFTNAIISPLVVRQHMFYSMRRSNNNCNYILNLMIIINNYFL